MTTTTTPMATTTKKTAKRSTKKTTRRRAPKKPAVQPGVKPSATVAEMVRKVVLKKLDRKPVELTRGQKPHVPSGSFAIDDLIGGGLAADGSGLICPGYPCGRLIELYGPEASGKTTAALHAVVEAQRQGLVPLYLDFEHCMDRQYAEALGVSFDESKLLFYQPDTLEEGIQLMNIALQGGVGLIVVDSVAAMIPKEEMEAQLDKEGRMGALARVLGRNLPKLVNWIDSQKFRRNNPQGAPVLLLNQTRADVGSRQQGAVKTPGGYALKFYCSIRLHFMPVRKEYIERKNRISGKKLKIPFGQHTIVKVIKNKLDLRNGQTHEIFIRWGEGIDDYYSIIAAGLSNRVILKEGAWYTYKDHRYQGREKMRAFLVDNPTIFDAIRAEILSAVVGSAEDMPDDEDLSEEDIIARSYDEEFEEEHGDSEDPEEVEVSDEDFGV